MDNNHDNLFLDDLGGLLAWMISQQVQGKTPDKRTLTQDYIKDHLRDLAKASPDRIVLVSESPVQWKPMHFFARDNNNPFEKGRQGRTSPVRFITEIFESNYFVQSNKIQVFMVETFSGTTYKVYCHEDFVVSSRLLDYINIIHAIN